ncbi:MAG: 16S rRNA pseudouridine(516) synthase RsuA [Gammaproteobacteria bacterium]|nr:16S rRNA pseudouridine(516) synthase RsuA [Gammaproteobacteria bacterium]NVK89298.1 16S rRNA pseudouridine(516) synthase RsuA [Gammaproteobacteria bacterium]
MKFPVRLDRLISQATDHSRKQVKYLLKDGYVTVNGEIERQAQRKVNQDDRVELMDEPIGEASARYFMLHKPQGFISATKDKEHLTVLEFIDEPRRENLSVAGRLDIDTTGLVLLTDDGQWLHQVISPKHQCEKAYRVETTKPLDQKAIAKLEQGVWLNNEKTRTAPAQIEVIDEYHYRIIITEGRYHQVKRMFAAVENHVESLHRERIAGIVLDSALAPGEYRALTQAEIESVGKLG